MLQGLLRACRPPASSGVVIGPRYGEDAAVIDIGAKYLVAKTDPITFTEERIGWYAVHINANDIATLGRKAALVPGDAAAAGRPYHRGHGASRFSWIYSTPAGSSALPCAEATRKSPPDCTRPIVVGQMLGEVKKSELIRKESQQPGDLIILTRGVAIEGTAILARAKGAELQKKVGRATVSRAKRWLVEPGISVVHDARLAVRSGDIHAMHDPTEGGLLSGLAEIAQAGGVGLRVWKEKIPILPETLAFSRALHFDPLALIASGALLVVAAPASVPRLLLEYARQGIPGTVIGEIRPQREGILRY